MADIINMPSNPEPRKGSSGLLVAGFGLLAAGVYYLYRKVTGKTTSVGTGGGGGFDITDLLPGGGESSGSSGSGSSGSGDTPVIPEPLIPEPTVPVVPEVVVPDSSVSSVGSTSKVTTSTLGVSNYKSMSDSVASFLLAGHTKTEQATIMEQLAVAEFLRPDYYVIDTTRNGTPVYQIISGTTGQIVGGGAGISYADAVARGVESRDNLYVVGSNPDTFGSSSGSAVTAQKSATAQKSGSGSSSGTSSGTTVKTSTGFTFTSTASSNNSAVAALRALREKKK